MEIGFGLILLIIIPFYYLEKQLNKIQDSIDDVQYTVTDIKERLVARGFLLDDERPPEI